jgi:hypothetical protein
LWLSSTPAFTTTLTISLTVQITRQANGLFLPKAPFHGQLEAMLEHAHFLADCSGFHGFDSLVDVLRNGARGNGFRLLRQIGLERFQNLAQTRERGWTYPRFLVFFYRSNRSDKVISEAGRTPRIRALSSWVRIAPSISSA